MAYISKMSVNIIMGSAAYPYKCAISTCMYTCIRIGSPYEHWMLAYSQHTMHMAADKHLWESFSHIIRMDGEGGETERRSGEGGEAVGAAHLYRQLERRETNRTGMRTAAPAAMEESTLGWEEARATPKKTAEA